MRAALLPALLILAACADEDAPRGGVTAEEARQLDETAAMLDEDPNRIEAALGPEPEAEAQRPSEPEPAR